MEETKDTAMMSSSMVRIGMLCYSRLTQLDLTGPWRFWPEWRAPRSTFFGKTHLQ